MLRAVPLAQCDVVYVTRVQKERFASEAEYEQVRSSYVIDRSLMARVNPAPIALMHPLPRVGEIAEEVDAHPRAAYFPADGELVVHAHGAR